MHVYVELITRGNKIYKSTYTARAQQFRKVTGVNGDSTLRQLFRRVQSILL